MSDNKSKLEEETFRRVKGLLAFFLLCPIYYMGKKTKQKYGQENWGSGGHVLSYTRLAHFVFCFFFFEKKKTKTNKREVQRNLPIITMRLTSADMSWME
jgi:hypothetical protein